MFKKAIKSSLETSTGNVCDVILMQEAPEIQGSKTLMLTISSYLFRLVISMNYIQGERTNNYFASLNKMAAEEMCEQALCDAMAEYGNMCCGILNRELNSVFPHTGMSTPNFIDANSMGYMKELGCGHIQHFKVESDTGYQFYASLGVCDFGDLDFVVDMTESSADTGELELF